MAISHSKRPIAKFGFKLIDPKNGCINLLIILYEKIWLRGGPKREGPVKNFYAPGGINV
jgi:hypothetical protein